MNKKVIIHIITVALAITICLASVGVLAVSGAIVGAITLNPTEYVSAGAGTEYEDILNMRVDGKIYFSNDTFMLNDLHCANDYQNLSASSGSEYTMDVEAYNTPKGLFEKASKIEKMKKDARKLADTITADVWKIVAKHSEISSENTDDRSTALFQSVTIKINSRTMEAIITETYHYFRYSQEIIGFLYEYECIFAPIFEDFYNKNQYTCLADVYIDTMKKSEHNIIFAHKLLNNELESLDVTIVVPRHFLKLINI